MRDAGHDEVMGHLTDGRVHHQDDRDEEERSCHEHQAQPLEAPEAPGAHRADDGHGGDDHGRHLGQAQVGDRERDADELGDDGQRVQEEQVNDAERAPELAEALEDEPGMAHAGHGAEAKHHVLADVEHRDQEAQCPHEMRAEVLTGLSVGREGAGVVVADHDDQPGPDDGKQRLELERHPRTGGGVAVLDGAQGAVDVADVGVVEDGDVPAGWCKVGEVLHGGLRCARRAVLRPSDHVAAVSTAGEGFSFSINGSRGIRRAGGRRGRTCEKSSRRRDQRSCGEPRRRSADLGQNGGG